MNRLDICPVILAGGAGTRLWPLSREAYPKQLLSLRGERTLLQETVARLDGVRDRADGTEVVVTDPITVCNEEHRFLVLDQLDGIGRRASQIPLEPVSRNTAPALTVSALSARALFDDPILLVMPADHVIVELGRFHEAVLAAAKLGAKGAIVTFGVVPARPETGFGYIKRGAAALTENGPGAYPIEAFVEKPDAKTAQSYVASGDFLWNSGMFVLRTSAWLAAIEKYRPDIWSACADAWDRGRADGPFYRVEKSAFEACPSDSIDYAVMEPLAAACGPEGHPAQAIVVPLDAGWSDIGSWPALLELEEPDPSGNVLHGDAYGYDTEDCLLVSDHKFVAAVGIRNTIVVETKDAVLVADRDRCQDVKQVVAWLKSNGREEATTHLRVHRPWGSYEQLDAGDRYQVKRLTVKPGAALSLQMHHHRAEHWVVVRGTARVTRGDDVFLLSENQSTYIPLGTRHRLENPGKVMLEVIEVQSGSYLGEDDIVRFEDRYNRQS